MTHLQSCIPEAYSHTFLSSFLSVIHEWISDIFSAVVTNQVTDKPTKQLPY
jgi:hypothetical protein